MNRLGLNILSLPIDIYHYIQEFTSINALLKTSKRIGDVKHFTAASVLHCGICSEKIAPVERAGCL
jgi:hypothetical protein